MHKKNSISVNDALHKLQRFCTYQERCHQEVRRKLQAMNMIPQAIDHIIVSLIEDNYLNEERFAKTFVQGKFRIKKWGKHRLTSELKKKDISKSNINQALAEIDEAEYVKIFNALAEKRLGEIKEASILAKKRKLADYLLYRGWESHMVYDKVRELIP